MNAEPKPLASLSSSLLARKGQASPAMRRQSMMTGFGIEKDEDAHAHEDLGWNDMGHDRASGGRAGLSPMSGSVEPEASSFVPNAPVAAPVPIKPELVPEVDVVPVEPVERPVVVQQMENLAAAYEQPAVVAQPRIVKSLSKAPRAAPGSKGKAAFTLRLDPERHLKLRLICAVKHKSAQQVVTEALDLLLARSPEALQSFHAVGAHKE